MQPSTPNLVLRYPWLPTGDTVATVCCMCAGKYPTEEVYRFTVNERNFSIQRCIEDDLMYLNPQPGAQYAEALYNHPSYFSGEDDMYGHAISPERGKESAEKRITEFEERGGLPRSLLEVGCGLGYTLEMAQARGILAVGVEFSDASVGACMKRGLDVSVAAIEDPVSPEARSKAPYDAIALYSVLEHFPDPRKVLEILHPILADRGRLVLRVPKASANGPWLSLLDHYWHFTERSLRALLFQTGFDVKEVFPSGSFTGIQHPGNLESMTIFAAKSA